MYTYWNFLSEWVLSIWVTGFPRIQFSGAVSGNQTLVAGVGAGSDTQYTTGRQKDSEDFD